MTSTIVATPRRDRAKVHSDEAPHWSRRGVCTLTSHVIEGEGPGPVGSLRKAARAAHLCTQHCPVLAACSAQVAEVLAEVPPRQQPVGVVQAGIWFANGSRREGQSRARLVDTGHGAHCQHLRGVR